MNRNSALPLSATTITMSATTITTNTTSDTTILSPTTTIPSPIANISTMISNIININIKNNRCHRCHHLSLPLPLESLPTTFTVTTIIFDSPLIAFLSPPPLPPKKTGKEFSFLFFSCDTLQILQDLPRRSHHPFHL